LTADSSTSSNKACYSFTWAMSIVEELYAKYPRATEIEMAVYSLSKRELAAFLAHGDHFWTFFRNEVHKMADVMHHTGSLRCNIEARRRGTLDRIHTVSSKDLRERVTKRLTSLGSWSTLEEQSRKGPVESSGTPEGEAGFLASPPSESTPIEIQYLLEFS